MKIIFWASDKDREQDLAHAFCLGAREHGHEAITMPLGAVPNPQPCDLACMVGVKSKRLWEAYADQQPGAHRLMLDKGYSRHRGSKRTWEYWRVSLDAQHPTETTLMRNAMPHDRFERLEIELSPWRSIGANVIIAGSSAKYHEFHNLPDPTTWAASVIKSLRKRNSRPIIYRPKPSWRDAVPIKGSIFSPPADQLGQLLSDAHVLITHGSNACFDAIVLGVPVIVLGNAVARPVSSISLDDIMAPKRALDRVQWMANLAYHQFTEAEFENGLAWATIGGWIDEARI